MHGCETGGQVTQQIIVVRVTLQLYILLHYTTLLCLQDMILELAHYLELCERKQE